MNPKSVSSIFGTEIPSLNNAIVRKMIFDNNGPVVDIYFDVENYPSSPPVKWTSGGYNTAQIWMKLIEADSIKVDGWHRDNIVNIQLREIEDNLLYLSIRGSDCAIDISFKWLDVGATGYRKEKQVK